MSKSKVYEKRNVLPGGGGNNAFIRPQTQADPLPQQPQSSAQMLPNENMRINSVPPKDPDNLPLQTPQSVNTQPQRTYNPQPPEETIPQQPQNDKPMQPVQRANYWSPSAATASFSSFTPTPPTSPTSTYTPSTTDPTQSVMDFMLAPSKEEQKMYRDNESKKRLLLLTDALRHIGNIYNTTRGATPQQFTSPVVQQEQLYQQKKQELRGQRQLALKNAMNQAKLQAEQAKLKADQDYKNSILGMRAAELDRQKANDDWNRHFNLGKFAYSQEKDKNDLALKLAAQGETARHNRASEGLRRQSNSLTAASLSLRQQQQQTKDLKDLQPIKIARGGTGYISKRWISSPEGRAEIKAMYNRMRSMKERLPNGKLKPLINEAKIKKDQFGTPISAEPSTMDMLIAMQEGAWSQPYMEWIGKYGVDPTGNNWYGKSPTYYKKVAKGQQQAEPTVKPKTTTKQPTSNKPQKKQKSPGDKYSKYER